MAHIHSYKSKLEGATFYATYLSRYLLPKYIVKYNLVNEVVLIKFQITIHVLG